MGGDRVSEACYAKIEVRRRDLDWPEGSERLQSDHGGYRVSLPHDVQDGFACGGRIIHNHQLVLVVVEIRRDDPSIRDHGFFKLGAVIG